MMVEVDWNGNPKSWLVDAVSWVGALLLAIPFLVVVFLYFSCQPFRKWLDGRSGGG